MYTSTTAADPPLSKSWCLPSFSYIHASYLFSSGLLLFSTFTRYMVCRLLLLVSTVSSFPRELSLVYRPPVLRSPSMAIEQGHEKRKYRGFAWDFPCDFSPSSFLYKYRNLLAALLFLFFVFSFLLSIFPFIFPAWGSLREQTNKGLYRCYYSLYIQV